MYKGIYNMYDTIGSRYFKFHKHLPKFLKTMNICLILKGGQEFYIKMGLKA